MTCNYRFNYLGDIHYETIEYNSSYLWGRKIYW